MADTQFVRSALTAAVLLAQPFPEGGSTGGTGPVSPSVLATEMCITSEPGVGTLELLVLWRGTPGWFRKSSGGSGGGAGGSMAGGPSPMVRTEWISQGGVSLTVRLDPVRRIVWIQDKEVALLDANVVLVDDVDLPAGPQVVRTLRVDPAFDTATDLPPGMPSGPPGTRRLQTVPAQTFIRRSPELVDFLRCGTVVAGLQPYEQQVFDMWCSWVTQP